MIPSRILATLLCFCFLSGVAFAQSGDSLIIQTLTWKDITKRKGTWQFPPKDRWEKILMLQNLKCDPATTQDKYPYGEWDYITNAMLYDSTGVIDSLKKTHSSFMIGAAAPDSFAYTTGATYTIQQRWQQYRTITATTQETETAIGTETHQLSLPLNSDTEIGKGVYLWTADELKAAGLTAGPITGLTLAAVTPGATLRNLTVRMKGTTLAALAADRYDNSGFATVYQRNTTITAGSKIRIDFTTPFAWNGTANLMVELSCDGGTGVHLVGSTTPLPTSLTATDTTGYIEFGSGDYVNVPDAAAPFGQLDSAVTVSFWALGDRSLPSNTYAFEGRDAEGNRVLNVHLPWSDGNIYWDAGNNGGAFDRINKAATADAQKGGWNHWAFTKNVRTGAMRIFLNGKLWHSGSGKAMAMSGITTFVVGRGTSPNSDSYRGGLAEFSVWNKELDTAAILNLMNRSITPDNPNYQNLILYYPLNDATGTTASDGSASSHNGVMMGLPIYRRMTGDGIFRRFTASGIRPNVGFLRGQYDSQLDSAIVADTLLNSPTTVVMFEHPTDPTIPTDTLAVWPAGYSYTYAPDGSKADSTAVPARVTLRANVREYYQKFEVVDVVELGRFITPYGIGLDLGPNGFTWIYDVTDYAPYLHDQVTISAGNQQELIDLKFLFIRGTPPRDVVRVNHVWPSSGSYSYRSLAENTAITEQAVKIDPAAKGFRIKTRITGHGHEGTYDPNLNLIHCCEWANKKHYLHINGVERFAWDIWQNDNCAMNPVMAQGGNWAPPRAGWCPGATVDDYEFELTPYVSGDSVRLDYSIDPVPANNTGQGTGNYVMTMDMIQYGAPNFQRDATVDAIIKPTSWEFYRRFNPMCSNPIVRIKNTGATEMTSAEIRYGVVGGASRTFGWTGRLKFLETATLEVPFAAGDWYSGGVGDKEFFAEVITVNGAADEYPRNNKAATTFTPAPVYAATEYIFRIKNNAIPNDVAYTLKNSAGVEMIGRSNMDINATYLDTFQLPPDCYTLEITTNEGFGLAYPLISAVGSGSASLRKIEGGKVSVVRSLPADFGKRMIFSFAVGLPTGVPETPAEESWSEVYPNPSPGEFTVEAMGNFGGRPVSVTVVDPAGRVVSTERVQPNGDQLLHTLDLRGQPAGTYLVTVSNQKMVVAKKVVVSK
ncbi:MAG: T9SS type A sorting domain-containing protein [Chlorobi bacterium]|nr:T9SS type A sorting domain-containing protein [Chlorobiota bacterium]